MCFAVGAEDLDLYVFLLLGKKKQKKKQKKQKQRVGPEYHLSENYIRGKVR